MGEAKQDSAHILNEWESGLGTTRGMWEMVSEALAGEKLPDPINSAIYALCEGSAVVVDRKEPRKCSTTHS